MTSEPTAQDTGTLQPPVLWVDAEAHAVDPGQWQPVEEPPHQEPEPESSSVRRRIRLLPRSLTGRLVAGVVSLVVVLVLVTGVCTYFALRSFLFQRLDQQVTSAASQPAQFLIRDGQSGPSPQAVWITELERSGLPIDHFADSAVVRHMSLSSGARVSLAAGSTRPRTITTTDGHQLRVLSVSQPGLIGVVVIGLATDEVHRTLHRLLDLELLIGAAAIVIAMVSTMWGVQFSLRRLRTVTATAHEVAAELSPDGAGLDRRINVTEPDTEVGQLATSMNTLLSAVETQFAARLANEQRMRQFLADASHELRTPLTSIRGFAELARMQRQQGTPTEDNLARIESEGTRMSRLVDDLLTLARSDQGGEPIRNQVELASVVDEAIAGVRAAYPQRTIDVDVPFALSISADRDQLMRVVRNLTTNAVVHTRSDGPIRVSVRADAQWAVLQVADSGPGLPPDEAAHVFERFWRADKARTRVSGGSGLGLAIVASIVAAHGGTVHFDSTVATGTTVTVRLPRGTQ